MAKKKNGRAARAAQFRSRASQGQNEANNLAGMAMGHFGAASRGFSMQDEARNTGHHPPAFSGTRLRDRPVAFVSAGIVEPLKDLDPEVEADGAPPPAASPSETEAAAPKADSPILSFYSSLPADKPKAVQSGLGQGLSPQPENSQYRLAEREKTGRNAESPLDANDTFIFDTSGDKTLSQKTTPPQVFVPDSEPEEKSDSSEEVILFRGRLPIKKAELPVNYNFPSLPSRVKSVKQPFSVDERLKSNDVRAVKENIPDKVSKCAKDKLNIRAFEKKVTIVDELNISFSPPRRASDHYKAIKQRKEQEEDAIWADYLANLARADEEEEDKGQDDTTKNNKANRSYRSHFGLHGLGASDSDVQLDEEDEVDSDAEDGDDSVVADEDASESDFVVSSKLVSGEEEDEDDDEDEELGMDESMTDEQIARLLAKQEELGLGSNDLVLFDGFSPGANRQQNRSRKSRNNFTAGGSSGGNQPVTRQPPSAAAVADAFDDLDLMDWGRPSLQKQPKGKCGVPTFNLSDSEMEATLKASWQRDRLRKKEKKQEREELRAQGLLGKNVNPDDPRVKYQDGMKLDEVIEELKGFLLSDVTVLHLPPMDAASRKLVHELANKFKIKSKSAGSGDQRRPALYRTKNTVAYGETYFEEATTRMRRRYFPRLDKKGRGAGGPAARGGGAGGGHKAVTVRDGEVVGGSAPELAETNKGRTMLQKMGWSTGMALGSIDNKGILLPVAQVVKRSRAGLG